MNIKEKILDIPSPYGDANALSMAWHESKELCAEVAQQEVEALIAERQALLDALGSVYHTAKEAIQLCEAEK